MKALMLGACLAATLGAPALAQPYDQGGYEDQRDPYYDQGQGGQYDQDDRTYQGDRRYDQDEGGYDRNDYDQRRDWRTYGGLPPGAHFTGRTGPSWRNAEGQSCAWRQMSWQDEDGNAAYRWVQRCHY